MVFCFKVRECWWCRWWEVVFHVTVCIDQKSVHRYPECVVFVANWRQGKTEPLREVYREYFAGRIRLEGLCEMSSPEG